MGIHTQDWFKDWFKDNPVGIDLGNVEVKGSDKTIPEWVIKKDDTKGDFLVVFSRVSSTWYFMNCSELPKVKHKKNPKTPADRYHRSLSLKYAKKWSYLVTEDEETAMNEFEDIVAEPEKYLTWLMEEKDVNQRVECSTE